MKNIIKKILKESEDEWDWTRESITYPVHEKKDFEVGMVGSWFYESAQTQIEDCEVIFIEDEENCGKSVSDCVITKLIPENYRDLNVPSWSCSIIIPDETGRCLYPIVNEKNPFMVKTFNI
jgi:hypothetical protein